MVESDPFSSVSIVRSWLDRPPRQERREADLPVPSAIRRAWYLSTTGKACDDELHFGIVPHRRLLSPMPASRICRFSTFNLPQCRRAQGPLKRTELVIRKRR